MKYTYNDAKEFSQLFTEQEGKLYKSVESVVLTGDQAAGTPVQRQIDNFKRLYDNGEIAKEDMIVLFFATHGVVVGEEPFLYMQNYQSGDSPGIEKITKKPVSGILESLKDIECKKLLFIDACYSGFNATELSSKYASRGDVPYATALEKLREPLNDWVIFASSKETSFEHEDWQHGAFTKSIINTVRNCRGSDDSGMIEIVELGQSLKDQVKSLLAKGGKTQEPVIIYPKNIRNEKAFKALSIFRCSK